MVGLRLLIAITYNEDSLNSTYCKGIITVITPGSSTKEFGAAAWKVLFQVIGV